MHDDIVKELDEHGVNLIKKICSCYTSIRLKHHARLQNQKLKKKNKNEDKIEQNDFVYSSINKMIICYPRILFYNVIYSAKFFMYIFNTLQLLWDTR